MNHGTPLTRPQTPDREFREANARARATPACPPWCDSAVSDHREDSIHQRAVKRIEGDRGFSVTVAVRRIDRGAIGEPEIVVLTMGPNVDGEARLDRESALGMAEACDVLTVTHPEPTVALAGALRAAAALINNGGEQ